MKILVVGGARPNFVKIAPVIKALKKRSETLALNTQIVLLHTGQHGDFTLSESFFLQLGIPKPEYNLGVSGGGHGNQTGRILVELEPIMEKENPDIVVVVGDVNSTLAAALCAAKLKIKVAHVEAGLRSFDKDMPEEINRVLTDSISDYLLVSEPDGLKNLAAEGIDGEKVYHVGNVMIDSLLLHLKEVDRLAVMEQFELVSKSYVLGTFHRPVNVDNYDNLRIIVESLSNLAQKHKIVLPLHPRTKKSLLKNDLAQRLLGHSNILVIDPQPYLEFISLQKNALVVLTDSGGIQEESLVLNTPCVTLRENTERPITLKTDMNVLCKVDLGEIKRSVEKMANTKRRYIPELWDGRAGERIAEILLG